MNERTAENDAPVNKFQRQRERAEARLSALPPSAFTMTRLLVESRVIPPAKTGGDR